MEEARSQKSEGKIVLDVSGLASGVYFLRMGNKTAKFIKH
jgi:hypothetical protein